MGFMKWIKRELDSSNSCKRRQSEPPLSFNRSAGLCRDESYVKALSKFNEWRHRQIFGSSTRLSRKNRKSLRKKRNSKVIDDPNSTNHTEANESQANENNSSVLTNDFYEEIQAPPLDESRKKTKSKVLVARHSFPIQRIYKNNKKAKESPPGDQTIYENEIFQYEQGCLDRSEQIDSLNGTASSPPVKFYKENSNPFAHVRSPLKTFSLYASPTRLCYTSSLDKENSVDPTYQRFEDLNTDDLKFDTSDKSTSAETATNSRKSSQRFLPYQTVINKHGDEVEYALPFNEKSDEFDAEVSIEASDTKKSPKASPSVLDNTKNYQRYIDKNFEFLNGKDPSGCVEVEFENETSHIGHGPVTDLDKTNGTLKTVDGIDDILEELKSLEMWSRSISKCKSNQRDEFTQIDQQDIHNSSELLVCTINSIKINHDNLNNPHKYINGCYFAGTFHNVPVTQYVPAGKDCDLTEKVLRLNFDILRKIRHPDVGLLMGVSADSTGKLNSLILEPLKFSLNQLIHKEDCPVALEDCLAYALQINKATTFLHDNGIVHSNICSHSVMVCQYQNAVKLTSFELASRCDNEMVRNEISSRFSGNFANLNSSDLPHRFLPHYIEYRKQFSEHFYQAPELLATESQFVFPSKQCDIYGISLTLWEMLNGCVPFSLFSYDDMKKLFYLKHAQLPVFAEERCKSFEAVLQSGLDINPDKRAKGTLELQELLENVDLSSPIPKKEESTTDVVVHSSGGQTQDVSLLEGFSQLLSPKACGSVIYERTSTIKKRKNIAKQNRFSAKQLFLKNNNLSEDVVNNNIVQSQAPVPPPPDYEFDIGEMTLPDTPIARSNKLRKAAWLANKSISPIVSSAIESAKIENTSTPQTMSFIGKSPANKKYNVSITILQKTPNFSPIQEANASNISNQIRYWNSLASTPNNQQEIVVSQSISNEDNEIKESHPASVCNNEIAENSPAIKPANDEKPIGLLFNEIFSRNHLSSDNDFENSLWKREKEKCELSGSSLIERNGVLTPRRVSVKDAVSKFESFSKSYYENEKNLTQKCTKSSSFSVKAPIVMESSKEDQVGEPEMQPENVSKLNVTLRNNLVEHTNTKTSEKAFKPAVMPRLSLGPGANMDKALEKQPMLLTLNFKKLDRRASDVGNYFVQASSQRRDRTARHSIYGTEIFKRLSKNKIEGVGDNAKEANPTIQAGHNGEKNFENSKKDFKIKVGKLTCLNCGHKLFVVDDIERNDGNEAIQGRRSELFLSPLKRNPSSLTTKSTEDLYIDDDFCEDFELGANMELGTRSELFDFIDFDILAAEIFNPFGDDHGHIHDQNINVLD